ncbi:SET domain-containing protein [Cucurbitaria berberidis CBS 394.84]|uniref:SET domain-containing protein n=1 Tax=Cucurbitaria berberidis CBS 394.84 TaxID=1168544 RepID=A0A9P4GHK8_9PLEO|nr:SET domain-containing protein [Cucurbitaria berberidis CBS 394.84]KAF1845379.1 SET domain-containing protein [Cucurbitaria berberidis CBS 394.84]
MSSKDFSTHPLAQELVTWFTQNGGSLSSDVQVVNSDSRGFHMRAVRPLSSPVVASSPLKLTLSILNLDPDEKEVLHIESPLRQCQGKIPDHILAYLILIEQRKKGTGSPWHAYIACLPGPESMTTPLWFDGDDMAFLTGTSLAPAARERKEDMQRHWEQAVTVMKELCIPLADEINFELLLWAATIFTSRAFISTHILPNRETIPLLFPVVDILNHSVSAKVEWDFQPHQSFALKCLEGETFEAGQELFNNYAPKQNDELLLGYGFCLEDNPIEQFALKLAFSPMLQQYAQEMNLLHPENVPFSMSPAFLDTDPNKEQHFLRAKGHPFGRYENCIPYFRGIPPYIVHFFFIQTLLALDADVRAVNVGRPDARITLQVLVLLHQAIEQRCHSLPLSNDSEPSNYKQKYAKIYRDGQAKIIHSVRSELKAAVDRARTSSSEMPPRRPVLLSTFEAILALEAEFPAEAQTFRKGLNKHEIAGPEDEGVIWTLLLTVFASLILTTPKDQEGSLISSWLRDLFTRHPLPALEDGIEDAETYTFVDSHLADFLHLTSPDAGASPTDVLDDLGLTFVNQPVGTAVPVFIDGRTENLGVRIVMWAMRVAEQEVLPVFEGGALKKCLSV